MEATGEAGSAEEILAEAKDPNDVRVVLLRRVWTDKIIVAHPEMEPFFDQVLATISKPDHVRPDRTAGRRSRCYARGAGPSNWLLVVVSYEQAPARIVSAFANRKDPPTWKP